MKIVLLLSFVVILGGCEIYTDESGHRVFGNALNDKTDQTFVNTTLREAEQNNK